MTRNLKMHERTFFFTSIRRNYCRIELPPRQKRIHKTNSSWMFSACSQKAGLASKNRPSPSRNSEGRRDQECKMFQSLWSGSWVAPSEQNNTLLALERFSFLCGLGVKTTERKHILTRVLVTFFVIMTQTSSWGITSIGYLGPSIQHFPG